MCVKCICTNIFAYSGVHEKTDLLYTNNLKPRYMTYFYYTSIHYTVQLKFVFLFSPNRYLHIFPQRFYFVTKV